jgi:hypothetical protein
MKTLVIHPQDPSTDFLSEIYNNSDNFTIIRTGLTKGEVKDLIKKHEKIIMMGHGSSSGLFSVNQFKSANGYIIDSNFVDLLKNKQNIFIWCFADEFVKKYNLSGFSTGMFISEAKEAIFCEVKHISAREIEESNFVFTNLIKEFNHLDSDLLYQNVMKEYKKIAENNLIAQYNCDLIKLFKHDNEKCDLIK